MDYYKNEYFEYALTIGLTVDEYWFGDPSLIYHFERAYENKYKLKEQQMWLMGVYIQQAVSSVPLNVNGFIEKQSQLNKYPNCPNQDVFDDREPISEEQKALYEQTKARLMSRGLLRDD